ncbi:uncharacterized protein AMSG_03788, partial [Thecamonas trahens ATCC 50062]
MASVPPTETEAAFGGFVSASSNAQAEFGAFAGPAGAPVVFGGFAAPPVADANTSAKAGLSADAFDPPLVAAEQKKLDLDALMRQTLDGTIDDAVPMQVRMAERKSAVALAQAAAAGPRAPARASVPAREQSKKATNWATADYSSLFSQPGAAAPAPVLTLESFASAAAELEPKPEPEPEPEPLAAAVEFGAFDAPSPSASDPGFGAFETASTGSAPAFAPFAAFPESAPAVVEPAVATSDASPDPSATTSADKYAALTALSATADTPFNPFADSDTEAEPAAAATTSLDAERAVAVTDDKCTTFSTLTTPEDAPPAAFDQSDAQAMSATAAPAEPGASAPAEPTDDDKYEAFVASSATTDAPFNPFADSDSDGEAASPAAATVDSFTAFAAFPDPADAAFTPFAEPDAESSAPPAPPTTAAFEPFEAATLEAGDGDQAFTESVDAPFPLPDSLDTPSGTEAAAGFDTPAGPETPAFGAFDAIDLSGSAVLPTGPPNPDEALFDFSSPASPPSEKPPADAAPASAAAPAAPRFTKAELVAQLIAQERFEEAADVLALLNKAPETQLSTDSLRPDVASWCSPPPRSHKTLAQMKDVLAEAGVPATAQARFERNHPSAALAVPALASEAQLRDVADKHRKALYAMTALLASGANESTSLDEPWTATLAAVQAELAAAADVLAPVLGNDAVLDEVLMQPKFLSYIRGLAGMLLVGRRIASAAEHMVAEVSAPARASVAAAAGKIEASWAALSSTHLHACMADALAHAQRPLSRAQVAESLCTLCTCPVEGTPSLFWSGSPYHAACANLYVNRVGTTPPC